MIPSFLPQVICVSVEYFFHPHRLRLAPNFNILMGGEEVFGWSRHEFGALVSGVFNLTTPCGTEMLKRGGLTEGRLGGLCISRSMEYLENFSLETVPWWISCYAIRNFNKYLTKLINTRYINKEKINML